MRCKFLVVLLLTAIAAAHITKTTTEKHASKRRPIIFIGDTQRNSLWEFFREKNPGVPRRMYDKIASEEPECIFHMGDMVFYGSSLNRWREFDTDAENVMKKGIPIYPALGNHEYMGRNSTALGYLSERFPLFTKGTWYSKTIDRLAVIVLNSNEGELSDNEKTAQAAWYKKELSKFQSDASVEWIITVCHHSPFTNSTLVGRSKYILDNFVPVFTQTQKCIAFLSGHCHSYEHFIKQGRHFIVTGGGGGPRQDVKPFAGGKDMPPDLYKGGSIRDFNYCKLTFDNKRPIMEVIGYNKETKQFRKIDQIEF